MHSRVPLSLAGCHLQKNKDFARKIPCDLATLSGSLWALPAPPAPSFPTVLCPGADFYILHQGAPSLSDLQLTWLQEDGRRESSRELQLSSAWPALGPPCRGAWLAASPRSQGRRDSAFPAAPVLGEHSRRPPWCPGLVAASHSSQLCIHRGGCPCLVDSPYPVRRHRKESCSPVLRGPRECAPPSAAPSLKAPGLRGRHTCHASFHRCLESLSFLNLHAAPGLSSNPASRSKLLLTPRVGLVTHHILS